MDSELTPAAPPTPAPAPPAAPVSDAPAELSPAEKAVASKDQDAYHRARHKERFPDAKPAPAPRNVAAEPPAEPEPAEPAAPKPAATPERKLSKEQDRINESIRRAVDGATADMRAEIARLKGEPAPRVAAAPVEDLEPDPTNADTYPDGQFDRKYLKDLAAWQTRQTLAEHDRTASADRQRESTFQTFQTRAAKTRELVNAAVKADPNALDGIDPHLSSLRPSIDLKPGEPLTFGHVVADWLIDTDYPVALLKHLSDPAEQSRLASLPPRAFLKEQGRIEASFAKPEKSTEDTAPAAPQKPVTDAPEPPARLATRVQEPPDAISGALRNRDFAAYQKQKRAKGVMHWSGA